MTESRTTQAVRLVVEDADEPFIRTTQAVRLVVGLVGAPIRTTQAVRLTVFSGTYPLRTTQAVRLTIVDGVPCVTQWQQLWTITRRDGVVFRYTSLDVDFEWMGQLYKTCGALQPSAAEDAGTVGNVSNVELEGIFKDDGITEAALYGGLFDDAFVEVWLVPYDDSGESPRRLAAGWCGNLSHGENGFNMEVVGPGARIDQQALVQPFTPGCRWVFGSPQCGVDREAIKVLGTVASVTNRGSFVGTAVDPAAFQWDNGLVRWTSGENDGLECEVKTAVFGGGEVVIELWELAGFEPTIGDTFDLLPGCDLSKPTCKDVYANVINFGGFDKVPGQDSVTETPDAKLD